MASVRGPRFLADPEGEAKRFVEQLESESAARSVALPARYEWQSGYWCAVKNGTWPNVTGWAEHRQVQRIFAPMLDQLITEGVPKDAAWRRASAYAQAEMLARTTARKEASDRYNAQIEGVATSDDTRADSEPANTVTD